MPAHKKTGAENSELGLKLSPPAPSLLRAWRESRERMSVRSSVPPALPRAWPCAKHFTYRSWLNFHIPKVQGMFHPRLLMERWGPRKIE